MGTFGNPGRVNQVELKFQVTHLREEIFENLVVISQVVFFPGNSRK